MTIRITAASALFLTLLLIGCGEKEPAPKAKGPPVNEALNAFVKQLPADAIDLAGLDLNSMWLFQLQEKFNGKTCHALIEVLDIVRSKDGYVIYGKLPVATMEIIFKIKVLDRAGFVVPTREYISFHRIAISQTTIGGLGITREEPQVIEGDDETGPELSESIRSGVCFEGNLVRIEGLK